LYFIFNVCPLIPPLVSPPTASYGHAIQMLTVEHRQGSGVCFRPEKWKINNDFTVARDWSHGQIV